MKIFSILFLVIFICSCGNEQTIFTKDEPFVVVEITKYKNYCKYSTGTRLEFNMSKRPNFISDCGIYEVGDTVYLSY